MLTIALLIATAAATAAWLRQRRKTKAARTERDDARCEAAATKIKLHDAQAAARASTHSAYGYAVAVEKAERQRDDLELSFGLLYDELERTERAFGIHPLELLVADVVAPAKRAGKR